MDDPVNRPIDKPKMLGDAFLNLASLGKTSWGSYLLGFCAIGFIFLLGSFLLFALLSAFAPGFLGLDRSPMDGSQPVLDLVALCLTFLALIAGLYAAVCLVHGRPFRSLVVPGPGIRWGRLRQGFQWQTLFVILAAGAEECLFPGTYHYAQDTSQFLVFALVVAVFIPFQAASEEFLFRGYLLQALGHLTRQPLVLIGLNGLGFMALHFANPETDYGLPAWLTYFAWGAFLTLITLKDNGAELAIGVHIANNVLTGILINYEDSALPTRALFTASEIHPWFGLLSYLVAAGAMFWLLFRNPAHGEMIPKSGPIDRIFGLPPQGDSDTPQDKATTSPCIGS